MKNKKGFTLIELLAVIIILSVVVVITVPVVSNSIENSKKRTAIESANSLIQSAEYYFLTASPKYGKIDVLSDKLSYKGEKPDLGEVEIDRQGKSRIYTYVNGYCVTKEFASELYANKMNKEDCSWFGTDNYETTDGTTFTLNNQSVKNYLIYGNSIQATRSGKNLFNPSAWSKAVTSGGLTVQYLEDQDCFLINGTATATTIVAAKYINIPSEVNTSYVLSTQYVSGSIDRTNGESNKYAIAYFGNGDEINTTNNWYDINMQNSDVNNSAKINSKSYITKFWFYVNKGVKFNNYKVRIQLEKGTAATSYEEYGAMPSPEFPSEVKSTGDLLTSSNCSNYGSDACNNVGKYVIQVKNNGKNLFDKSKYLKTSDYTKLVNTYKVAEIKLKPNTTYKISVKRYNGFTGKDNGYLLINSTENVNGPNWSSIAHLSEPDFSDTNYTYTTSESGLLYIGYVRVNQENLDNIWKNTDIQIEEGNSATPYEEYKGKVTNIYLDEPLRKVDGYADYIDFNNKKVVRKVTFLVIDGFSSYIPSKKSEVCWFSVKKANKHAVDGKVLSPILKSLQELWWQNSEGIISHKINASGIYLSLNWDRLGLTYDGENVYSNDDINKTTPLSDAVLYDNASKYFTQKFSEGYRTIYYPLDTPTEESIDLPNIEVLDGSSTLSINTDVNPSKVILTTNK